jgi:hypothetical protein
MEFVPATPTGDPDKIARSAPVSSASPRPNATTTPRSVGVNNPSLAGTPEAYLMELGRRHRYCAATRISDQLPRDILVGAA